jgi:hypothetical protein
VDKSFTIRVLIRAIFGILMPFRNANSSGTPDPAATGLQQMRIFLFFFFFLLKPPYAHLNDHYNGRGENSECEIAENQCDEWYNSRRDRQNYGMLNGPETRVWKVNLRRTREARTSTDKPKF